MPNFDLTRVPPATRVSKRLLIDLETYMIGQAARVTSKSIEETKPDFRLVIVDGFGTETLKSATDLKGERLPDSVKGVKAEISCFPELSIRVEFSRLRMESSIYISYKGTDARETVVGIYTEIRRMLGTESTYTWLFHWPAFLEIALPIYALPGLVLMIIGLVRAETVNERLVFAWAVLILFLFLLGLILKPYSSFDSQRQKTFDETWKWFALGTLTFLVFGTMLPALRKWIAGF